MESNEKAYAVIRKIKGQIFYLKSIRGVYQDTLEPFYGGSKGKADWTKELKGARVFIEEPKKQYLPSASKIILLPLKKVFAVGEDYNNEGEFKIISAYKFDKYPWESFYKKGAISKRKEERLDRIKELEKRIKTLQSEIDKIDKL